MAAARLARAAKGGSPPTLTARGPSSRRSLASSPAGGSRRESAFGPASRRERPHVLLVLDEQVAPERALIAELLAGAGEHGVAVLWLGRERATCRASPA